MKLCDSIVALMQCDESRRYVYLSKSRSNMDALNLYVTENVDFNTTKVTIYVVLPMGIAQIHQKIDGVFADEGSTSSDYIKKHLLLKEGGFIMWVSPETQEII